MKLFAELVRIETALMEKRSVAEALAWCGENRGTLKKTKVSEQESLLTPGCHHKLKRSARTTSSSPSACKNTSSCAASATSTLLLPTRARISHPGPARICWNYNRA